MLGETEMEESVNGGHRAPGPGMFTRTSASTNGGVPRPSWPCPELASEGTRYVDHILCIVHYPIYSRRSNSVSGRIRAPSSFCPALFYHSSSHQRPAHVAPLSPHLLSFPAADPFLSPLLSRRPLPQSSEPRRRRHTHSKNRQKQRKRAVVRRRASAECG